MNYSREEQQAHIRGILLEMLNESRTDEKNETEEVEEVDHLTADAEGAMQFIICTIVVYAVFGVFCTLVASIKRKASTQDPEKTQDEAISGYLKREKKLKFEGYKMRLQHVCEQYSEKIRIYEEKMDLLDIERRRLNQELGLDKSEAKSGKKRKYKRRGGLVLGPPDLAGSVKKGGLSLVFPVDSDRGGSDTDDDRVRSTSTLSVKSDKEHINRVESKDRENRTNELTNEKSEITSCGITIQIDDFSDNDVGVHDNSDVDKHIS